MAAALRGVCAAVLSLAIGSAVAGFAAAGGRAERGAVTPTTSPSPVSFGVRYDIHIADANRVGMTLTNYGYFGNNFFSRDASLEFPRNSGYEHLVHGGLWIGAQAEDGGGSFTGVTTGVLDAAAGPTSPSMTEFTPGNSGILVRSSDPASSLYSVDAISHQDLIALYDDLTPRQAASNPEAHRPLGISVRQESYAWFYGSLQDILFLHFVVRNTGAPLTNLWVGFYTEFASGNKAGYVNWPPSSADPGGLGSWFRKKWLVYEDSLRMIREHYCRALPVPAGCQVQIAPPWIGLELLTPPALGQNVTLAAWNWSPGNVFRDQDVERYAIMSAGTIHPLTGDSLQPQTGDPVELLTLGPFASVASGDSISVDFAFVGGDDEAAIHVNDILARRVYDAGYANATTPTQLSLANASAVAGRVVLRWFGAELAGRELRVERRELEREWVSMGTVRAEASGVIEFEDGTADAGARYGYRLTWSEGGWERNGGETWISVSMLPAFRLHGVRPNPATGDALHAAFSLQGRGEVRLRLLDVSGRNVLQYSAGDMEPGEHIVRLGNPRQLAPGIYLLELSQGGRTVTARAAVVR